MAPSTKCTTCGHPQEQHINLHGDDCHARACVTPAGNERACHKNDHGPDCEVTRVSK